MILSNHLLSGQSTQHQLATTSSHVQLRDLLVVLPGNDLVVASGQSLVNYNTRSKKVQSTSALTFAPTFVTHGCGLIVTGGSGAELQIRSSDSTSTWNHIVISSGDRGQLDINNSAFVSIPPFQQSPRLLLASNDSTIHVYDISGRTADLTRSKRRRLQKRYEVESEVMEGEEDVEEAATYDTGGTCRLEKLQMSIGLPTAVNSCSVSPNGERMVAVGDSPQVFLFEVTARGYDLVHEFEVPGTRDASFSTDWSRDSMKFAVGSQGGNVTVFDTRSLPRSSASASASLNKGVLARIESSQTGAAGAIRKVQFSSGSDLLAFSEHRSIVQVVDSRTFDTVQVLSIPDSSSARFPSHSTPAAILAASETTVADSTARITRTLPEWTMILPPRAVSSSNPDMQVPYLPMVFSPSSPSSSSSPAFNARRAQLDEDLARTVGGSNIPRSVRTFIGGRSPAMSYVQQSYGIFAGGRVGGQGYGGGGLSSNFPDAEHTSKDILGFSFDEFGETLFVASGDGIVTEFGVDVLGRRCCGSFGFS